MTGSVYLDADRSQAAAQKQKRADVGCDPIADQTVAVALGLISFSYGQGRAKPLTCPRSLH